MLIDIGNQAHYPKKDSASAIRFLDSLAQNHYFFTELKEVRTNGQHVEIFFDKGPNYNKAHVTLSEELARFSGLPASLFTRNLDSLKKTLHEQYVAKGYSFSRIKTLYQGLNQGLPKVKLSVIAGSQRRIDGFALRGYNQVPRRFLKNLEKEYLGKPYESRNLSALQKTLQAHPFLSLERPVQTLFTKDSTTVYLFLQKRKASTFDGVVGFGNDQNEKFSFNGTLHLQFRNIFNGFEHIGLYWQRNPERGQTFDLQTDFPYLLKSNIGMQTSLTIFRQDSAFANVKFFPSLYYHLDTRQKIGFRGTLELSTVALPTSLLTKDYSKKGFGLWYDYALPSAVELFVHDTKINLQTHLLHVRYGNEPAPHPQYSFAVSGEKNWPLKGNHWLNLKGEATLMSAKTAPAYNELFRLGGWNSLRGFNERTLLGDAYYYAGAEYRYLIWQQAFFDVFFQYGRLRHSSLDLRPQLYSMGFGFNFFLPVGLISFQIANGSEFGRAVGFRDTKIHWGIVSRF
ncbi:BamA/TamA family outer membrane protein [Bergeyella sp. RCAD1439]|uniref:BamA/TamA family outer membrane protein n=1 Tax=Bergeyella anatis TaxID=3113737 RepID=UPI002E174457|nr:BamA/TamA family outer membrane protein [Bergeyella sp. RCAD1439]